MSVALVAAGVAASWTAYDLTGTAKLTAAGYFAEPAASSQQGWAAYCNG